MKTTSIITAIAVVVLGGAFFAPTSVFAYRGDPSVTGPNYTAERHTAMEKAFDTNDYNSWKSLMVGQGRITQVVNAQNFVRFAQAHNLAEQGKTAEANAIRAELGLGLHNGSGQGMGYGRTK